MAKPDPTAASEPIVFDTETHLQTWAKAVAILVGLYLSIVLGPLLDGTCPYPALVFGVPALICAGALFVWLAVAERYLFDPGQGRLIAEIRTLSFRFEREIARAGDIIGITTHAERFTSRLESLDVYYYQVVLALTDGRIFPLSHLARDRFDETTSQAEDFARRMGVACVKPPPCAAATVETGEGGQRAIVHRPLDDPGS